jgi:hypothetical protein
MNMCGYTGESRVNKENPKPSVVIYKGVLKVRVLDEEYYGVCGAEVSVQEEDLTLSTGPCGVCSCELVPRTYTISVKLNRSGFGETKKITVQEDHESVLFFLIPKSSGGRDQRRFLSEVI